MRDETSLLEEVMHTCSMKVVELEHYIKMLDIALLQELDMKQHKERQMDLNARTASYSNNRAGS